MLDTYKKLSIFYKMLIAPAIGITLFLIYLTYTSNEHNISQQNLESVKSVRFPILEIADQNFVLFEKIEEGLKDAISAGERSWIEDTIEHKDEYFENLKTLENLYGDDIEKDVLRDLEKSFNDYYSLAIEISKRMIDGDNTDINLNKKLKEMNQLQEDLEDKLLEFRSNHYTHFKDVLDETSNHLNRILYLGIILGTLTVGFTIAMALVVSIPIKRSLKDLLHSIKDIASGEADFTKRINKTSNDELGDLVESFNTFTEKLEGDYTELEEAHKNLKETQEKLIEAEKMASLGGLVAGVAHEINTPIGTAYTTSTAIEGAFKMVDLEAQELDQVKTKKVLKKISKGFPLIINNLQRASELIKSFKQVSVDQHTDTLRDINLYEYILDLTNSLKYEYHKNFHTLILPEPTYEFIKTYPGAIGQIVTNLVMNSVKHGFKGLESKEISIDLLYFESGVKIVYKDNGRGMTDEVLKKVFDPFFTTDKQDGTGLGMNVVYNLISHKLNGTIEIESAPNQGVSIEIVLPKSIKE